MNLKMQSVFDQEEQHQTNQVRETIGEKREGRTNESQTRAKQIENAALSIELKLKKSEISREQRECLIESSQSKLEIYDSSSIEIDFYFVSRTVSLSLSLFFPCTCHATAHFVFRDR